MNRTLYLPGGLLAAGLALLCLSDVARGQQFLGKPMQTWRNELNAQNATARRSAAFALGKIGKDALDAVGVLTARLGDDDATVREAAAFAIGEISVAAGTGNGDALKALCQHLQTDKDPLVRRSAAYAIGCMGKSDDKSVRAALNTALKDTSPAVRQNVAWALGRIGEGDDIIAGLRQGLSDGDPLVRRDAAKAVAQLNPDTAYQAKPELIKCCLDTDSEMRKAAVAALARVVGPDETDKGDKADKDARAALLAALQDKNSDVEARRNAALGLGNIGGPEAVPAVSALLEMLRKGDLNLKRKAALAFKNVGPWAKEAVPDLRKALRDPDEELRYNTTVALIGFKTAGESAVPDLAALVENKKESPDVRKQAAVALSRIGHIPSPNMSDQGKISPELKKVMPTLLRVVSDPSEVGVVRERTLWPVRVQLMCAAQEKDREPVYKALLAILTEPPQPPIKMLRYDCAYLMSMFQGAKVPNKAMDVLFEFLKDTEIKIYAGGTGSGGTVSEGGGAKAGFNEKGVGDGRVMAVDALLQIGAERVKTRPDIVQQLRALDSNPNTAANLRKSLKELMPKLK